MKNDKVDDAAPAAAKPRAAKSAIPGFARGPVISMLVLVALCVVAYLLMPNDAGRPTMPAVVPDFHKADVTAFTVKGPQDTLPVQRRDGASDQWDVVVGTELVRGDNNVIDDILTTLSRQEVHQRIERKSVSDADMAGYGLDKPTIEYELQTASGKPVVVRYGKLTREGGKVYMDTGPSTDVWVVPKDAMELGVSGISSGLKDKRLFDTALYDVSKYEVVRGGVTTLELVRDQNQIWRIRQPFVGYANPTTFETELAQVVNVEIVKWEEFGAPDLAKYGLDKPAYEVRVTPKGEGKKPEVLLVGAATSVGAYVMEAGTKSVATVGRRFFDAVSKEALFFRDRSFTRLGIDGSAVDVQVGDAHYRLEKTASTWEVAIGTERRPAEGDKVGKLMELLREWQTVEFLDEQKPEDLGFSEKEFVEITLTASGRDAPGKLVLFFGKEGPDEKDMKTVYGRRKDDGGVERVDAGPLEQLKKGPEQFFRLAVTDLQIEAIDTIERTKGTGPDGVSVQEVKIHRDLGSQDKSWSWEATGHTGKPDGKVISDMLKALYSVKATEWIPFQPEKDNAAMGFTPPKAETLTVQVHLANTTGIDPDPKIYVGKRRPQGGYFARMSGGTDTGLWVFILPDQVVDVLKRPLSDD